MGKGLNRRTFVRGATGAVGMGAVGAFSKLRFANADEPDEPQSQEDCTCPDDPPQVVIPVYLLQVGSRKEILCPDAQVDSCDLVCWEARDGVGQVEHVIFKGGSPWPGPTAAGSNLSNQNLDDEASGDDRNLCEQVPCNARAGKYRYTIVVREAGGTRRYAKDPDLDII